MQNTTLTALAASIRVIGDEFITIAEALKADATAAPLAQDAQQAFARTTQQQPPAQQQQFQQPPTQQQPAQIGGMTAPEQQQPAAGADEFTAFSNALIDLGRQAGPQGLVPIMPAMLQRYAAPPGNDLIAVPVTSYEPFLTEVRAYVASLGGQQ